MIETGAARVNRRYLQTQQEVAYKPTRFVSDVNYISGQFYFLKKIFSFLILLTAADIPKQIKPIIQKFSQHKRLTSLLNMLRFYLTLLYINFSSTHEFIYCCS